MEEPLKLNLAEEILLLSLDDGDGNLHSGLMHFQHVLASGLFCELLLQQRIAVSADNKKLVNVIDHTPTGTDVLDELLLKIKQKPNKNVPFWIRALVYPTDIKDRVAQRLCNMGILRAEKSRILFFIANNKYPQLQAESEQHIINHLREVILNDSASVDLRTTILIALAKRSRLLGIYFDKSQLKDKEERINKIVDGTLLTNGSNAAVEAAGLASTMAAVTAATVVITA